MKNLMTRNIMLGMFTTLVLVFSVQSISGALTFDETTTGDLQTIVSGASFNIGFSVMPTPEERKPRYADYTATYTDTNGIEWYYRDDDNDKSRDSNEPQVRESEVFYYNNEAVRISVSGANARITDIGSNSITPTTSHELEEGGTGANQLTNSVTVNCSASGYGEVTITVRDDTPGEDYPSGVDKAPDLVITTYVVRYSREVSQTAAIRLAGVRNGVAVGYDDQGDQPIYNGDSSHYPVTYTVSGGGLVYIQEGNRTGNSSNTLATSSAARVLLSMEGSTNTVTATIPPSFTDPSKGVYIFGRPQLMIEDRNSQSGNPGAELEEPFIVKLQDGSDQNVPGVAVKFDVTNKTLSGGALVPRAGTTIVDASNIVIDNPLPGSTLYVQTDTKSGGATVDFQLGTASGEQTVTVSALGISALTKTIKATATPTPTTRQLSALDSELQQGSTNIYDLVVLVENGGKPEEGVSVEFRTIKGLLTNTPSSGGPVTSKEVTDVTDPSGRAHVVYNLGESSGSAEVVATISVLDDDDNPTYFQEVIFNVRGGSTDRQQQQPQTTRPTLVLSPATLTGNASASQQLIVSVRDQNGNPAPGIGVTFTLSTSDSGFVASPVITNTSGIGQTTVVLPNTNAVVTASAVVGGSSVTQAASISVTGGTTTTDTGTDTGTQTDPTGGPSEIVIDSDDELTGEVNSRLDEDLTVQVLDINGEGVSNQLVTFRVTEGSGAPANANRRTNRNGYASIGFTPRSDGPIEVEVSVAGVDPVYFTISTGEPPAALKKISGDTQSGKPGAVLANPFVVEVVDANGDPVSGTTVAFAATAGGGSVSPRSATTNSNGRAQTTLTLGDAVGDNAVTARVSGIPAVTFRASAGATVLVDASARAPLYWVSRAEGKLQRLVDDEVENLATNIEGVTGIAVDSTNGLLYFAVQTGNNKGAIRRSGLNGRNVQTLKTLTAVPLGIALDASGSTVYWTNSRGRIQSIAAEGSSQLTNLLQNLANPTAIAVSNGYVYWAEPLGRMRRANLTANQQVATNIATGLGEPLSLAIAKGKIYWIERSGNGGALQRANLNGTNIEQLKSFTGGVPTSLAVDSSDNKLYWTRSTGKIQRSNLMGRFTTDIATGLMSPSGIALGVVAAEPVVQQTATQTKQPKQPTIPTTYSMYDINRDGSVNNADTKAVAGAVGQSGSAITNPRTDVDGSGTVDVTDLILVIANLDDDVAAPAIDVDLTMMDLDFDRVQEQVEMLLSSGDRSHAAQRALLYLQHLLASARPDATILLVNYPNPFNPETWIPYHLASSTDVKINIYNSQGMLVRALTLGHQSAGYYTSRSRAAYWDGRNALGERVASGIYFYQLQADEISPLRKMVILK